MRGKPPLLSQHKVIPNHFPVHKMHMNIMMMVMVMTVEPNRSEYELGSGKPYLYHRHLLYAHRLNVCSFIRSCVRSLVCHSLALYPRFHCCVSWRGIGPTTNAFIKMYATPKTVLCIYTNTYYMDDVMSLSSARRNSRLGWQCV